MAGVRGRVDVAGAATAVSTGRSEVLWIVGVDFTVPLQKWHLNRLVKVEGVGKREGVTLRADMLKHHCCYRLL
jgi:hypothetical protein